MRRRLFAATLLLLPLIVVGIYTHTEAQSPQEGFSLQVTPSPIIATISPGKQQILDLKIRNANTVAEDLKLELRDFSIDSQTGEISISDSVADSVSDFVSFGKETFRVEAGEWSNQQVIVDPPANAGFSYSFAIMISRQKPLSAVEGGSNIEGSVAVFTLLNVDRPDAVRKLELSSFVSAKKSYEYLPAEFELSVKNIGNTVVQPKGSIFIGRSADASESAAVLQINPNGGYIIPDSTRVLNEQWNDGFPSRNEQGKMVWDWTKVNKLRIGKYTARAVLIYDDGARDIPIESTVTFWVLPWKLLLGFLVILLILGVGLFTLVKHSLRVLKARPAKQTEG